MGLMSNGGSIDGKVVQSRHHPMFSVLLLHPFVFFSLFFLFLCLLGAHIFFFASCSWLKGRWSSSWHLSSPLSAHITTSVDKCVRFSSTSYPIRPFLSRRHCSRSRQSLAVASLSQSPVSGVSTLTSLSGSLLETYPLTVDHGRDHHKT